MHCDAEWAVALFAGLRATWTARLVACSSGVVKGWDSPSQGVRAAGLVRDTYSCYGKEVGMQAHLRSRLLVALIAIGLFACLSSANGQQSSNKVPRVGVLWHAGSAEEEKIP